MGVAPTRSEPGPKLRAVPAATLEDLYRVEGKAELVGGSKLARKSCGTLTPSPS
jgi:hypothetical protein